jgi:hypothetical protein
MRLAGGDLAAALLLMRIADWFKSATLKRGGREWVVKTRNEWCEDTGLSVGQYNRAIAWLKKLEIVAVEQHLFGKTHQKLAWIRLEPATLDSIIGKTGSVTYATAGSTKSGITQIQNNTENNTDSNSFGITKPPIVPQSEGVVPGEDEMKTKDVIEKYSSPKKSPTPHSPPSHGRSAMALGGVWQKALAVTAGGFQPSLTMKQLGQLKQIGKQCPPGKAGAWLDHTVAQWQDFVLQTKANYSLDQVPLVPDIGFVLKYIGEFVKFNLPAPEPSATKMVVEAPKPAPVQLIAMSPKKATLEELQAILAESAPDT